MRSEALFRDTPVWQAIAKLVIPSVLTILIMVIYNLADMYFISMLKDDMLVAAVAAVSPVFSLANALATMIGAGGSTLIANALGEKQREKAQSLLGLCLYGSVIIGAVYGLVLLAGDDIFMSMLGITGGLAAYVKIYMRTLACGAPFMLFSIAAGSAIRAEGIIIPGMLANVAGTAVNLILDPLLILVFHMGLRGAALATVLGNCTACALLIRAIRKHSSFTDFTYRPALGAIVLFPLVLFTGLPNGISATLSGFASAFGNRILAQYGDGAIAANAAAGRGILVITMVNMGICMGVSPLIAYCTGAENYSRLKEVLIKTLSLTTMFGFTAGMLCFLFRDSLSEMFLNDPDNLALCQNMMIWLIAASPFLGIFYLSSNFLQASKKPLSASVLSALRQGGLLIPALWLMNRRFGLYGIAAAHTAADTLAIMIAGVLALLHWRKLIKNA